MEAIILMGLGLLAVFGLIFLAQAIVWTWEAKERNRKRKTLPEPRRKGREDYWAA